MRNLRRLIGVITLLSVAIPCFAAGANVAARYKKTCSLCHSSGAGGAPRTGNREEWAPRLEKGMPVLINSAKEGSKVMPPKGMCFDCSDDDFKTLIEFMSSAKK